MPPKRKATQGGKAGPSKKRKTNKVSNNAQQTSGAPAGTGALQGSTEAQTQKSPAAIQAAQKPSPLSASGSFVVDHIRYTALHDELFNERPTLVLPTQRLAPISSPLAVLPDLVEDALPPRTRGQQRAAEKKLERRQEATQSVSSAAGDLFWRIRHAQQKKGDFQGDFCAEVTDPRTACLAYLRPSDCPWEINDEGKPVHQNGNRITEDEMKDASYNPAKETNGVESLMMTSDVKFRIQCNKPKNGSDPTPELPEHLRDVQLTIRRLPASCVGHEHEGAGYFLQTTSPVATTLNNRLLSGMRPKKASEDATLVYGPLTGFSVIEFFGLPIFFWRKPRDRTYVSAAPSSRAAALPKGSDDENRFSEAEFHFVHEDSSPPADTGAKSPPPDKPSQQASQQPAEQPTEQPTKQSTEQPQEQSQEEPQGQPQEPPQEPPQERSQVEPPKQVDHASTVVSKADLEKLNCVLKAVPWSAHGDLERIHQNPRQYYKHSMTRWRFARSQYRGESYYTVPHNDYLQDEHLFLGIAAVTEAITQWGSYSFSSVDMASKDVEWFGANDDVRAARPRRPLLLPVTARDKTDDENKRNHFFLIVAYILEDDPQQKPRILLFDSCENCSYGPRNEPKVLDGVGDWIGDLKWVQYGDNGEGAEFQRSVEPIPVAQQTNGAACGIHVVLNAWAWAFGLRVNPSFSANTSFYTAAAEIIDLAIIGYMDFWTIYAFLRQGYVLEDYDLASKRHFPVTRGFRSTADLTNLHMHIKHLEYVEAGLLYGDDGYRYDAGSWEGMAPVTGDGDQQATASADTAPPGLEAPPIELDLLRGILLSMDVDLTSEPWGRFMEWAERMATLAASAQQTT